MRAPRRCRPALAGLLAPWLAFVADPGTPALAAQEPAADTAAPPSVPGGVYDRPFLTTLLGRTALGGYAEADARFERVDGATEELGFLAKRFNLFTATRVSDFVRIGAELEVEEGGEEITLEYAAIDVIFSPAFTLRAGMILAPLGRFNLSHDSPRNDFADRPLVSTELLGVALSEPGLGALGGFSIGGSARFTWEVYLVNGFHEGILTGSPDGTRIPAGAPTLEDDNHSPSVVGRLAIAPRDGWEAGLSVHHGAYNLFEEEGLVVDERRDLTLLVLDLGAEPLGMRVQGEGAFARLDLPEALTGPFADRQRGFWIEALRDFGQGWVATMPTSFFSAGLRVEAVDFDARRRGETTARVTFGLDFRPTADTALKLGYLRGRSHDGFNNRSHHAGVVFSLATYF